VLENEKKCCIEKFLKTGAGFAYFAFFCLLVVGYAEIEREG